MYIRLSLFLNTFHFDLFCQLAGVGVNEKVATTCMDSIAQELGVWSSGCILVEKHLLRSLY